MAKRMAAAFLWYAMVWVGYEVVWSIVGIPRMIGPILAASVAITVALDPLHRFWPRPGTGPSGEQASDPRPDVTVAHTVR